MALLTFGEGYHNFHHEFQHDYRNGVKWWQWDPTKWTIWLLSKLGLTGQLRRVPNETIREAELRECRRSAAVPAAPVRSDDTLGIGSPSVRFDASHGAQRTSSRTS